MGSDGKHHIVTASTLVKVLLALMVLTVITVAASRVNFGSWNVVIAMAIASVKAFLVLSIFMHLKYDDRLYIVAFGLAIFFLVVMYLFSWLDWATRIYQGSVL